MSTHWTIPEYAYDQFTTLSGLLRSFLQASSADTHALAIALGISKEPVDRWLQDEFTEGLVSRYKQPFETLTGIDLERLFVIHAKREILRKLENLSEVRVKDPSYARLLTRDPELSSKIDFSTLTTRDEVIEALRPLARETGYPLIALQLGIDDKSMSSWVPHVHGRRPSGENLERCLIGLTTGLICSHKDDTRFRLVADAILGKDYAQVLCVTTLEEAVESIIGPHRSDPETVIANRTGLTPSIVGTLRRGQFNGSIPMTTMIQLVRTLFKRSHKDHLGQFDLTAQRFLETQKQRHVAIEPVNLAKRVEPASEAETAVEEPRVPAKPPPITKPAADSSFGLQQVRALAAMLTLVHSNAEAELRALAIQFPDLVPSSTDEQRHQVPAIRPLESLLSASHLSRAQIDLVVRIFEETVALAIKICSLAEDQREAILGALDPFLAQMQGAIEAAGTKEPEEYLEILRGSRTAAALLSGNH